MERNYRSILKLQMLNHWWELITNFTRCLAGHMITHPHTLGLKSIHVSQRGPVQYIPRNMHTVFALLCFVVVIHWLIFPYPSGLLHWHCGNLTIAPVPAKQPWWIWINTSCEFIMNDCITTTKQSTTKPCAYFLGYTVFGKRIQCHRLCLGNHGIHILVNDGSIIPS